MVTNTLVGQEQETRLPILPLPAARQTRWIEALSKLLSRTLVKKFLFLAGDIAAIGVAHVIAETLVHRLLGVSREYLDPSAYYQFYIPFFAAVLYLVEGYKNPDMRRPERELELIFKGVSLSFLALVCANFVLFKTQGFSRYLLVTWYLLAVVLLLATRFGLRGLYDGLWRRGLAQQRALLVGSAPTLAEYRNVLSIQRYQGYQVVGALIESGPRSVRREESLGLPVLGSIDHWEKIASDLQVQLIFLSLPGTADSSHPQTLEIIRRCQRKGIDVEVYSDLFGSAEFNYERDDFSGLFRFYARPRWSRAMQRMVKVILDRLFGIIGSAVTLLVLPFVALLIEREDPGPVFYRSEFVGPGGKLHHYLKFRTMVRNAGEILRNNLELKAEFDRNYKLKKDPRVLRIGRWLRKYSLDEFPEFFSLLTGQLTFVGPRTICSEETGRYGPVLPKLLSMRPGLTGYWQVMGRQTTTYAERIQMDMFYIEHWSIWLDLVIIAKTFWKVLRAEGAY